MGFTIQEGLLLVTWTIIVAVVGAWLASLATITARGHKLVPGAVEMAVAEELDGDDETSYVTADGHLLRRVGAALRIAKEVKLRFGGTPKYNEANRLLAARYIDEALTEHGVTRKIDRAKLMYRIRALVFTRLAEEREEDQWLNSETAIRSHRDGTGWCSEVWYWWMGLRLYKWGRTQRRHLGEM